jgi:hypothetical protein
MHGALSQQLPKGDAYIGLILHGGQEVPRKVAKAWINSTLGKGSPVARWSQDAKDDTPELRNHDAKAVGAAVMARYQFLKEPWKIAERKANLGDSKRLVHHTLTGIEGAILTAAMAVLRVKGILALPMHDGLIVAASAEGLACDALKEAGRRIGKAELRLTVDRENENRAQ